MPKVPGSGAITYSGPLRMPLQSEQARNTIEQMVLVVSVSSSAGGVINNVFGNNFAAMNESASFIGIYDEYRCLGLKYEYVPNVQNVQGTIAFGPMIVVIDRDNSAALASVAGGFNAESAVPVNAGTRFSKTVKMQSVKDAGYLNTNPGTTDTWWVKFYGTGLSNSTSYGTMYIRGLYEFRGRV